MSAERLSCGSVQLCHLLQKPINYLHASRSIYEWTKTLLTTMHDELYELTYHQVTLLCPYYNRDKMF